MIKIISIVCFLLISSLTNTYAQTETITIENDAETKSSKHSNFDVNFRLISKYGQQKSISVSLHNKSENEIMLLKNDLSKKTLKREYKVKYGKDYSGKDDQKITPGCQYLMADVIYIEPSGNTQIMEIDLGPDKTSVEIEFPVYYVRHKFQWCKKRIFLDQQGIKFNVEVNLYGHIYEEYRQRYEALKEEYESTVFCTNKAHKPTLEDLKYAFEEKRDGLANEVQETTYNNVYDDEWMEKFNDLVLAIKRLDVKQVAKDCGNHKKAPTPPTSKPKKSATRSTSIKTIREKLEEIHTELHNMDDPSAAKANYINQVKQLYENAARHPEWDTNKDERNMIVQFYNRINTLLNE